MAIPQTLVKLQGIDLQKLEVAITNFHQMEQGHSLMLMIIFSVVEKKLFSLKDGVNNREFNQAVFCFVIKCSFSCNPIFQFEVPLISLYSLNQVSWMFLKLISKQRKLVKIFHLPSNLLHFIVKVVKNKILKIIKLLKLKFYHILQFNYNSRRHVCIKIEFLMSPSENGSSAMICISFFIIKKFFLFLIILLEYLLDLFLLYFLKCK